MARRYIIRSKEEKLTIVKAVLNGSPTTAWENIGIRHFQVQQWVRKYQEEGEDGLDPKKKPGNPLSRYERKKELTYEEQLLYKIALLERKLIKKEAEVARLKQLNARKEVDVKRK
ncbi:MAG: helix-turn-helix domain-containing protein [Clostridia bacterium]|nr:helix-turn-helix domain-containing protein [Clostridia bacterium]